MHKYIYLISILLFSSCHTEIQNLSEYNAWLNNKENGCICVRSIAGIKTIFKYLPPEYSVLKEMESRNPKDKHRDSLLADYSNTICFLLTIGPDKDIKDDVRGQSIMHSNIENYSDYATRMFETNFAMDQYIKLYADGVEYKPVYTLVENLYELSDTRNFLIVFAANETKLFNANEYRIVYDDHFFNIGKIQAEFLASKMRASRNAYL